MNTDLQTASNMSQSLRRLAQHLRGLIRTMAGENPENDLKNIDPDYDGSGFGVADVEELKTLVEALDQTGVGEDWALERESEIARLEKENDELRKMLGIDEGSLSEHGVTLDVGRSEQSRLPPRRGSTLGGGIYPSRPPYYDPGSQQPSGAPLQRAMDLPGVRAGPQGRRPGIFGQHRGGLSGGPGAGRGMQALGVGAPSGPPSLWTTPPPSPAPPIVERSWPAIGSSVDLGR